MKKLIALLLTMMMVFAFTACGSSEEAENETTEAPAPATVEVSGIVDELADAELSIYTDADEELTFNIENAAIESEDEIKQGDTATVEYEGEITDGDTSGCKVVAVTAVAGKETIVEGKVEATDDSKTTITSNEKKYTFNTKDAEIKDGPVKVGDTVKIKYAGIIKDGDTSHAFVRSVAVAEKAGAEVTVKAVDESVWVAKDVNVRAEASTSSEKVATVKKGEKLTRTGVLSNGWSRVTYKDKDRYIKSDFLTTKAPEKATEKTTEKATEKTTEKKTEKTTEKTTEKKTTESKTTEKKTTEKKTTESKTTESTATEPTSESTTEPTSESTTEPTTEPTTESTTEATTTEEPTTEATTEATTTEEPSTEKATDTTKGIITDYVEKKTLTLDNDVKYDISEAKVDLDDEEEIIGLEVEVEYYDGTTDAIHVYKVDGAKALVGDASNLGILPKIFMILGLIVVAIAVVTVIARNRRNPAAK